jgi:predicted small secreted protein
MKLGIMQPYLFPYLGYWQLIKAVDLYVVYDDVTYIKGGWINRNHFLINGEKKLFTIKLKNAGSYKLINEIEILDDFANFTKMLQTNYSKAPYFHKVMELIKNIIVFDRSNLSLFILNSFKIILEYLNIKTNLLLSSSIEKDNSLKGKEKVLAICKHLKAAEYYNAIGGYELYKKEEFKEQGISLFFLKTNITPYTQFKGSFTPGLSIIDVLMFNSPGTINDMLDNFELV